MSAVTNKPGVEINIWLPRDGYGNYVSALKGAAKGRVGHASIKIYPQEHMKQTYAHLMGNKDYVYASLWPDGLVRDFYCGKADCREQNRPPQCVVHREYAFPDDVHLEPAFPNAVVRLNRLDVGKMLKELNKAVDTATWKRVASGASRLQNAQSCSAFCYNLLEIGEIFDKGVYKGTSCRGPGWNFYYATNCHLGDVLGGVFNSFSWRTLAISPKLVLHLAASAAESDQTDKEDTLALMQSEIVQKDEQSSLGTIVGGTMAVAAVGGTLYIRN